MTSLSALHAWIYKKGWKRRHHLKVPVISVGNLTFGGTGKTPVTQFLSRLLVEKGHRPGIASRAYKAQQKQPRKIRPFQDLSSVVGDEALLLANSMPQIPVFSGRQKWQVAEALCDAENVDVVLLDDGFQHLALYRDLDVLVFDASQKSETYCAFPKGRARENLSARHRAHLFFLTKCNLAGESELKFHRELLSGKDFFEFNYEISHFETLMGQPVSSQFTFGLKKVLLVSALARPESFTQLIQKKFPKVEIESMSFPDHHSYKDGDIEKIARKAAAFDMILTTEKDAVKLRSCGAASMLKIWLACLEIHPQFSIESLYDKIDPLFS